MAQMIPESISADLDATPGEKRVFRVLKEVLQPDEDYLVWHEPNIINRYPDFVVWGQDLGLLVIEVKDWEARRIIQMNPNKFILLINNKQEQKTSPFVQVKGAKNQLMSKIRSVSAFVEKDGRHAGNPKFPIEYCVVFTNIRREEAENIKMPIAFPDESPLFSDDLPSDLDSKEEKTNFKAKLKKTFPPKFYVNPLTYEELSLLRTTLFPEVHVNQVRPRLRKEGDEESIKCLDNEQEQIAKSIGEGHRILKGVAGSGKTLALACRAKYLMACHPHWKILVVCYNICLSRYLKQLIDLSGPVGGDKGIDIFHFHSLVRHFTGAADYPKENNDLEIGNALIKAIENNKVSRGMYDAILIDEGQDFLTEWMQGLTQLLNTKTDSLLFCYDPAQNVFGRSRPNWKIAGFKVQGKRPKELKIGYRTTVEILETAKKFTKVEIQTSTDEDESLQRTLYPTSTNRHGLKPLLNHCKDANDLVYYVLKEIDLCLRTEDCRYSDIAVLYADNRFQDFPKKFHESFNNQFGEDKIFWAHLPEDKRQLDLSKETVKLMTIHSAKGLEFKVVFLIGLESMPRFNKDEEDKERRLAYTGLTRAEDILYLPYIACTGYIKELKDIVNALPAQIEKK